MYPKRLANERGVWGIVALLVVVAIGFLIYALVISPNMSRQQQSQRQQAEQQSGVKLNTGKTVPGAAMDKAKEVNCQQQLIQIRQAIAGYKMENDNLPAALSDLRMSVGAEFFRCPVGNESYSYDPATGNVRCVHPGHEGL